MGCEQAGGGRRIASALFLTGRRIRGLQSGLDLLSALPVRGQHLVEPRQRASLSPQVDTDGFHGLQHVMHVVDEGGDCSVLASQGLPLMDQRGLSDATHTVHMEQKLMIVVCERIASEVLTEHRQLTTPPPRNLRAYRSGVAG
ncbi:hypothetical protein OOK36_53895 [Streptomyces sp. NBC_00365]|uniref:hypothetical protein n=1 Tax=Streptomyces sp. NBC_00365 TaxID=2975726 RepID=UPI00225B2286|nr:hypothetical protein [Streptomyces sp. NBC_00365]MCX5097383.1 hypothetical protein [Streptomyces sp. NBC_00365]